MTVLIILLILCLLASGIFSASETAFFSLSPFKVKSYQRHPEHNKRLIAKLLVSPRDLLVTLLMLNIAVNILVQNFSASLFGDEAKWTLNVGIPLILTLIFGEIIPKSIGLVHNEKIASYMAGYLAFLQKILLPIRYALIKLTSGISRVMFWFLRKERDISIEELQHALQTSRENGIIPEDEAELIQGYLSLRASTVKTRMRPRTEVLFFDIDEPLSKLVHLFVDQECSRIPVCTKGLDQILGIVTSRSFFLQRENLKSNEDLRPILETPFFIPETVPARLLLKQFYDRKETFGIVVNEYGSVSGIVALEDLVETVVGEIDDRRQEKNLYTLSGKDIVIASGKMELSELERIFHIPFVSENNRVTIGGYLIEKMGDIPKSGTKFLTDDFLFHILSADPNRIRRIYIRRIRKRR